MLSQNYKEKILRFFRKKDRFAASNLIEVVDVKEGWAKAQVMIKKEHLNGVDIAHGGIIFTLADVAFGVAANSYGRVAVTLSAEISFLNPAIEGTLITAEAEELALKNTISSYLVSVKDVNGQLLATMKCTAFRKKERIVEED